MKKKVLLLPVLAVAGYVNMEAKDLPFRKARMNPLGKV